MCQISLLYFFVSNDKDMTRILNISLNNRVKLKESGKHMRTDPIDVKQIIIIAFLKDIKKDSQRLKKKISAILGNLCLDIFVRKNIVTILLVKLINLDKLFEIREVLNKLGYIHEYDYKLFIAKAYSYDIWIKEGIYLWKT